MKCLSVATLMPVLALAFSPAIATPQDQAAPSAQASPPAPSPEDEAEHQAAIAYDRANRMTINVTVNDQRTVPFVIDTGSERTVISDKLAAQLALPVAGSLKISGVAGSVTVPSARVSGLDFPNVSVPEFIAPVLNNAHMGADGMVGIDSLQSKMVVFDFDHHRMEIREAKRRSIPSRVENDEIIVTASKLDGRMIITQAYVEGIAVTVVIDSGAQYSIGNPALLAKLQKRNKVRDPISTVVYGVTGQQLPATIMKAHRVEIGQMSLGDMPIAFADSPAFATLRLDKKPAMLLGMNTLRAFRRVEVDFTNKRVRFITPGNSGLERDTRYASSCAGTSRQCAQATPGS